jgi:hypothetical protein
LRFSSEDKEKIELFLPRAKKECLETTTPDCDLTYFELKLWEIVTKLIYVTEFGGTGFDSGHNSQRKEDFHCLFLYRNPRFLLLRWERNSRFKLFVDRKRFFPNITKWINPFAKILVQDFETKEILLCTMLEFCLALWGEDGVEFGIAVFDRVVRFPQDTFGLWREHEMDALLSCFHSGCDPHSPPLLCQFLSGNLPVWISVFVVDLGFGTQQLRKLRLILYSALGFDKLLFSYGMPPLCNLMERTAWWDCGRRGVFCLRSMLS